MNYSNNSSILRLQGCIFMALYACCSEDCILLMPNNLFNSSSGKLVPALPFIEGIPVGGINLS